MIFPEPVIHVAIEPKTKDDQDKLGKALKSLSDEDPTFRVRTDEETGQTVISGMGELHLEILVDRMQREFGVVATVGKPQVAYRETITKVVESVEYRHIKQSGGSGQFAVVKITLEPNPGKGYEFVDKISGGKIPREYINPTNQGMQQALDSGVLAGYPTVDVKATLVDGQYHDVDSSEMAFKIAGQMAFKKAAEMARPVLLEPIMGIEVVTPEDYMGDVMGDLSSRRGRIEGMEARGNTQVIKAQVPLSEMFGYSTDLRSRTQGRATYTMQFAQYMEVPPNIASDIVKRVPRRIGRARDEEEPGTALSGRARDRRVREQRRPGRDRRGGRPVLHARPDRKGRQRRPGRRRSHRADRGEASTDRGHRFAQRHGRQGAERHRRHGERVVGQRGETRRTAEGQRLRLRQVRRERRRQGADR